MILCSDPHLFWSIENMYSHHNTLIQEGKLDPSIINNPDTIQLANKQGLTLLQIAARDGLVVPVIVLIGAGANVDAELENNTLEDAYHQNQARKTPLHHALERGHTTIAQILLMVGASKEKVKQTAEKLQQTHIISQLNQMSVDGAILKGLLCMAIECNHAYTIRILQPTLMSALHEVSINLSDSTQHKPSTVLETCQIQSLMEYAASMERFECLRALLTLGVPIRCDHRYFSAGYWAIVHDQFDRFFELAPTADHRALVMYQLFLTKRNELLGRLISQLISNESVHEKYAELINAKLKMNTRAHDEAMQIFKLARKAMPNENKFNTFLHGKMIPGKPLYLTQRQRKEIDALHLSNEQKMKSIQISWRDRLDNVNVNSRPFKLLLSEWYTQFKIPHSLDEKLSRWEMIDGIAHDIFNLLDAISQQALGQTSRWFHRNLQQPEHRELRLKLHVKGNNDANYFQNLKLIALYSEFLKQADDELAKYGFFDHRSESNLKAWKYITFLAAALLAFLAWDIVCLFRPLDKQRHSIYDAMKNIVGHCNKVYGTCDSCYDAALETDFCYDNYKTSSYINSVCVPFCDSLSAFESQWKGSVAGICLITIFMAYYFLFLDQELSSLRGRERFEDIPLTQLSKETQESAQQLGVVPSVVSPSIGFFMKHARTELGKLNASQPDLESKRNTHLQLMAAKKTSVVITEEDEKKPASQQDDITRPLLENASVRSYGL